MPLPVELAGFESGSAAGGVTRLPSELPALDGCRERSWSPNSAADAGLGESLSVELLFVNRSGVSEREKVLSSLEIFASFSNRGDKETAGELFDDHGDLILFRRGDGIVLEAAELALNVASGGGRLSETSAEAEINHVSQSFPSSYLIKTKTITSAERERRSKSIITRRHDHIEQGEGECGA